jgi:cellulose synthase/poly-beta-1,6-N-acetylglucosamine synthase-like glycosyltransferase
VIRSGAVDTAIEAVRTAIGGTMDVLAVPLIVYFAVLNSALLALVVLAFAAFRSQQRRRATALEWQDGGLSPGVSLLVPAHNEEVGIVTAVTSFLTLRYPRHEVVVVDDGSTDGTFSRLRDRWRAIWITILASALENIGYRQLTVWCRLEVWWASLRRRSHVWGVMTRTGFDESRP